MLCLLSDKKKTQKFPASKKEGISALIAEKRKQYLASKAQEVVGSPDYMAPEVLSLQGMHH